MDQGSGVIAILPRSPE